MITKGCRIEQAKDFVFASSLIAFSDQLYDNVTVVAESQYIIEHIIRENTGNIQDLSRAANTVDFCRKRFR
jgi:hypothetical protein